MTVTSPLFEAYLKCPTKCFLKSRGEADGQNAYANWIETESETYRNNGRQHLMDRIPSGECVASSQNVGDLRAARWRFAVDFCAHAEGLSSTIHIIERVSLKGETRPHYSFRFD
jgi:hypothetical protein